MRISDWSSDVCSSDLGLMGGWSPLMEGGLDWMSGTGRWHSRADRHPEVLGLLPSHALIADITVPGDDRVRALLSIASNAVISGGAGSGDRLRSALKQLDLFVSLDLYLNETNRHAHYILPTDTMYERKDFSPMNQGAFLRTGLWTSRGN